MSKVSAYSDATDIGAADTFLGRDVSDTSMAATGTTKEYTWSLIRQSLGIVPQPTQVVLGTNYTPSQLTMRPVHSERSRDFIPSDGPHLPLDEQFLNATLFTSRYTVWSGAGYGDPSSETVANGKLTVVAGASGTNRAYRAQTKLVCPSGVFAAVKVEPGWTGDEQNPNPFVGVGFYQSGDGSEFVQLLWDLDTGALSFEAVGMTVDTNLNLFDTVPGPTTTPIWIGLIMGWPVITAVISYDGENWDYLANADLTRTNSLLLPAEWSTFRPGFKVAPLRASTQIVIGGFRTGYVGQFGHLNHRAVTFADGTPLRRDGKYYLTCTIPHADTTFFGQHLAVLSFDPWTYQTELVSHLFFDWNNWIAGLSVGAICYDELTATWHVLASSWGAGAQSTGIDLVYGTTQRDLLSPSVHVIKGTTVTPGSNSMYDAAPRRLADGSWVVAAIETDTRTNWSTHQARLLTGPSLSQLTVTASDTSETVDGTHWMKCGGTWYILAGGTTSFLQWSASLTNKTNLTSWSANAPANLLLFSTFAAHPSPLVVDDGHQTRYLSIVYDNSRISALHLGTRGGMLVMEADEKPTGQEFAPRLVPRYIGA